MPAPIKLDYFTQVTSIHFSNPSPWYQFTPKQQPENLCLVGGQTSTTDTPNHWQVLPFLSFISFAPAFPDDPIDAPKIGFDSLEDAIDQGTPDIDYFMIDFLELPPELLTPPHNQSGATPFDTPNVWQEVGAKQPFTKTPQGKIITDAKKVTLKLKKTIAKQGETLWNNGAKDYNARMHALDGIVGSWQLDPPSWPFKCQGPGDPSDPAHRFAFTGPIPAAWNLFGGRNQILTPAYAAKTSVVQLDPKAWDFSTFPPVRK